MTLAYMVGAWLAGMGFAAWRGADAGALPIVTLIGGVILTLSVPVKDGERWLRRTGLCLIAFGLGLLRFQSGQPSRTAAHIATLNETYAEISGILSDAPDVREGDVRLRLRVESVRTVRDATRPAEGEVLLYTEKPLPPSPPYRYGDRLRAFGQLSTPPEFDEFSYRDYLAQSGVFSVMFRAEVTVIGSGAGDPLRGGLIALRESARETFARLLTEPYAGLLTGLVTGDETGISPDVQAAFRRTGTSHLLAISGSNVAVIIGLFGAVFSRILRRKWQVALLTIGAALLYAAAVGGSASVVRAAIMASLAILAGRFRRTSDGLTALAAAVWVITLLTPTAIFDYGLILSGLATFAILAYVPFMTRLTEAFFKRLFAKETARAAALVLTDTVLLTAAVQITVLPVSLLISAEFTPLSLLINALVAPAQGWIMILGVMALMLGAALPILGQIPAWLAAVPLAYTWAVIRAGASLAEPTTIPFNRDAVIGYYLLLFVATAVLSKSPILRKRLWGWVERHAAAPTVILAGAGLSLLLVVTIRARPDGLLHLWLIPGGGVIIGTPDGAHLAIDAGDSPNRLLTVLGEQLPFQKTRLDGLILTALTTRENAALPDLLRRYRVGVVILTAPTDDEETGLREIVLATADQSVALEDAAHLDLGSGVTLARDGALWVLRYGRLYLTISPDGRLTTPDGEVILAAERISARPESPPKDGRYYATNRHGLIDLRTDGATLWVRTQYP